MLLYPKSVGYMKLKSKNPFHWPRFYPGYLSDPEDIDINTLLASIRESQRIIKSPSLQKYGATLLTTPIPGEVFKNNFIYIKKFNIEMYSVFTLLKSILWWICWFPNSSCDQGLGNILFFYFCFSQSFFRFFGPFWTNNVHSHFSLLIVFEL